MFIDVKHLMGLVRHTLYSQNGKFRSKRSEQDRGTCGSLDAAKNRNCINKGMYII